MPGAFARRRPRVERGEPVQKGSDPVCPIRRHPGKHLTLQKKATASLAQFIVLVRILVIYISCFWIWRKSSRFLFDRSPMWAHGHPQDGRGTAARLKAPGPPHSRSCQGELIEYGMTLGGGRGVVPCHIRATAIVAGLGAVSIQNSNAWPRAGANADRVHYFRVAKGREVFHEGDKANAVFRVELGCIRLEVERADGEQDVVGFLFKHDIFSPGVSRYWASAHAVTDSLLSCAPLGTQWDKPSDTTSIEFAPDEIARDVVHGLSFIRRVPANARLFWFLKWLSLRSGTGETNIVELPMTGRDLANFLGVAPETVSRGFAELERQGRLRRLHRHQIELAAGTH